jgi:hypothetical protein
VPPTPPVESTAAAEVQEMLSVIEKPKVPAENPE